MDSLYSYIIEASKAESSLESILFDNCGDETYSKMGMCPYTDKIKKVLGKGEEGVVCLLNNGKVLKIYFRELPLKMQVLGQLCKQGVKFNWLPAIYDFGDFWLVRDAYKMNTTKCKQYYKKCKEYLDDIKNPDAESIFAELDELCGKRNADIKPDSFGELKDGTVKVIDF